MASACGDARVSGPGLKSCFRGVLAAFVICRDNPNGTGGWAEEGAPFNALNNSLGQLTSFTATGASPVFQWGHTYTYDNNANRTGGTITANGASMSFTNGVQSYSNRQTNAAGITITSNAAGDITSLLGKTLAYDTAGRLSEATGVPPCPGGVNCSGLQTTTSRYNGWGQRFLRENDLEQSVFSYGLEGFTLLSQTTRRLATSQQSTTEHIWLPTASGPMPVAAVIDGVHYAVHADHLNTPRRLSDASGQTRWQWPYSGFGEIAPQATPAAGQAPVSFALRYPGQIDDGNELFYNWHRFYEPRVGRYTKADPIGLEGGWNRFGYVWGNPLSFVDPRGLDNPGMGPYGGPWSGVWRCQRPINISWVGSASAALPNHNWLLTGTYESGMGARCPIPGQGCSDKPGAPTQTLHHSGQSSQPGSECEPVPNVDEQCVSAAIRPGQPTGRWMPWNQCQSFADEVLDRCSTKPRVPFMPGPGQSWR